MTESLSLSVMQEVRGGLTAPFFAQLAMREGLCHIRRGSFPALEMTIAQLGALGELEMSEASRHGNSVVLRPQPGMLTFLSVGRGQSEIVVAGRDLEAVHAVADATMAALRDPGPDDDEVSVTFWAYSPGPAMNPRRRITAPAWRDIRENYPAASRAGLDELMRATEPGPGGLLLWHGQPGTGKSYALRALAREWRDWCETHFVTDADAFLGGQTNYLLNALLRSARDEEDDRWRLVVLEDAGELLAADARAVAGQALSRLLNLTDGLLGAGLRALVLVTTNEPLRRLHPAVARPGRAWAEVEFSALDAKAASAWLARREIGTPVDRAVSVAELYALAAGQPLADSPTLGFAA